MQLETYDLEVVRCQGHLCCLHLPVYCFFSNLVKFLVTSWHKEVRPAFGSMSLRDYFQVLDILFNPGTNIQGDLRKRLQAQYPKVKVRYVNDKLLKMPTYIPGCHCTKQSYP